MSRSALDYHQLLAFSQHICLQGYDSKQQAVFWNSASSQLFGYSHKEAIGKSLYELILPDGNIVTPNQDWALKLVSDTPAIMTLRNRDGDLFDVFVQASEQYSSSNDQRLHLLCIDAEKLPKLRTHIQDFVNYFEQLLNYIPEFCYFSDVDGQLITKPNHDVETMLPALNEKTLKAILPKSAHEDLARCLHAVVHGDRDKTFEYETYKLGKEQHYWAKIHRLNDEKSFLIMLLRQQSTLQDEGERDTDQIYSQMFESNRAVKLILDPDNGDIVDVNEAAVLFYGYSMEKLKTMNISEINTLNNEQLLQEMANARDEKRSFFKFTHKLSRGEIRHVDVYSGPLIIRGKTYLYSIVHDVSERNEAEQKILHQAHYDALTNIPNRFLSLDRLSQLLRQAQRYQEQLAVMFIDLDDFKKVNDSLGHETGDKLLVEASKRFISVMRNQDTVGRLGGDEFIVLVKSLKDASDARVIAQNLMQQLQTPFLIDGHELLISASIGIAIYPSDGEDSSTLLRHSDIAMYRAKEKGRNNYSFFTKSMNQQVSYRLKLEGKMHGALQREEFSIMYQPQIDVASGSIIGAEALLRWNNQQLGQVSPVDFIPVAEQSGMIIDIGEYVIEESLKYLASIPKVGGKPFRMAVNISPRQLRNTNLVQFISDTIERYNVKPESLELEITEGVLMVGSRYVNDVLYSLSEFGIALSMDDFGTGYSSMSYLRQYPFDLLKIDRNFVSGISENKADKELVIATIAMAKALGLKVVAEGVETHEQYHILNDLDCDYAQGYLFGKPMTPEALIDIVKAKKSLI